MEKTSILTRAVAAVCLLGLFAQAANADCYSKAGQYYTINPDLLRAIATVESGGRLDATNQNTNDTEDMCAMQVNSFHLPRLAPYGITRESLLTDSCTCIFTGAFILAEEISRVGNNWKAVAYYHTRDKERGLAYAQKVHAAYAQIQEHEQ